MEKRPLDTLTLLMLQSTARVAFRYHHYTRGETVDADLQAWLRSYDVERPHRSYRTKGRTPLQASSSAISLRSSSRWGACDHDRHAA